ncbi:hypothetical protein V5799_008139 [Amblyomma americanum]|uniref:Uncharacterized protein n=1 Tax=Amblyomma americanum TaxID=6943 RepID=A0AAQ4FFV0_AMBAM
MFLRLQDTLGLASYGKENARVLNHFVRHYEPLSYEPVDVHGRARWKRSAHHRSRPEERSVEVAFTALKREFRLRLVRDRTSFTDDFMLVTNRGPVDVNLDHLYSGRVVGHPDSRVVGAIMGGVFVGRIALPWEDEEYHVERASRFFPATNGSFHSVLYSSRDVLRAPGGPFCGVRAATRVRCCCCCVRRNVTGSKNTTP